MIGRWREMTVASVLLRGLLIGLSIAAPVGPIGVLCIRRTLAYGRLSGMLTGLGAASADACYASIAGFGLTIISGFLLNQQAWIRLIGGLFLCFLGMRILLTNRPGKTESNGRQGLLNAYASAFLMTITNPLTILSFAAIFAGLGLGSETRDIRSAGAMIAGVFIGSSAWWVFLSSGVGLLRERFNPQAMRWVNWGSGILILGFGVMSLISLGSG